MNQPQGLVTVSGIVLEDGKRISTQQAVDYGWIKPAPGRQPSGWDLERHEISLGKNLFLDQGRQMLAFAFGYRSPISDYVVSKFSVGTGLAPAQVTDVALESPILLASTSTYTAPIDSVDYLQPFVVRVTFTIATGDANGFQISELGLVSGGGALIARKVRSTSISKTNAYAPVLTWRIRF